MSAQPLDETRIEHAAAPPIPDAALMRVKTKREQLLAGRHFPVVLYSTHITETRGGKPIVQTARGKVPYGRNWEQKAREGVLPPPSADLGNTGILCAGLRVLDLDIDDETPPSVLRAPDLGSTKSRCGQR